MLVVNRDLAVQDQGAGRELRGRRRDLVKASSVVAAVPADQADAGAVLVREDSPSVDLLFVDLPVAVKRLADERRSHRRVLGQHRTSLPDDGDQKAHPAWTQPSAAVRRRSHGRHGPKGDDAPDETFRIALSGLISLDQGAKLNYEVFGRHLPLPCVGSFASCAGAC